jgi:hypothetical protein
MKGCIFVDLMINLGSEALYVHVQFFIECGSLILKKKKITGRRSLRIVVRRPTTFLY